MKQFLLNKEPDKNNFIRLDGGDYHYLVKVRRLAVGEYFTALLPNGSEAQVQIMSIENGVLVGKYFNTENITQARTKGSQREETKETKEASTLILFQALPKGDKMDLIVRQAAEGGIAEIVPFVSEFSIAKANASGQKYNRWEKIIKEARQQSGSKTATTLRSLLSINDLLNYWHDLNNKNTLGVIFHHQKGLEQNSLHEYLNSDPQTIVFVIGPEGGFSEKEVSLFLENGFKTITIGDTVLRTETAALYCAAAIRILLLERNSWELKQTRIDNV